MIIRYLADENIPSTIIKELNEEGFEIENIPVKKRGIPDIELLNYAFSNNFILLTFDKDFGQLIFRDGVKAIGIVLLRFSPTSPTRIKMIIKKILEDKEFKPQGKFVVVHETHMRIVDLP
ncbi:MAG: DUF5615 family PIN-like protein [Candidatus Heimdallarchaeota archaeon]